jgi:hypothetical protein
MSLLVPRTIVKFIDNQPFSNHNQRWRVQVSTRSELLGLSVSCYCTAGVARKIEF